MKKQSNILLILIILKWICIVCCQETENASCSFTFVSDPEGAKVFINNNYIGTTPCEIDTINPGSYSVILEKKGYKKDTSNQVLPDNTSLRVFVQLEEITSEITEHKDKLEKCGTLEVSSQPSGATVLLDSVIMGNTPFKSDSVDTGTYTIYVTKPKYLSFKERIIIDNKYPTTLNVLLLSKDSLQLVRKRKFRRFRRIFFGSLGAGFFSIGLITHAKLKEAERNLENAWADYEELGLSTEEYDKRYSKYKESVDKANSLFNQRKIYNAIGGAFSVGFIISIPF